jgi:uncharacterized protein YceH (UPF0502 family)
VLGSLLEKDITTPEYYPLTLKALVAACNQKNSREPIVQYDEETVMQALALLRTKGFASRISGPGHRVDKFAHLLGDKLNLGRRELALLCVLMLRGPQTPGQLRDRCERRYDFTDLDELERVLEGLATREPEPLVTRTPRGRWAQLLGGPPEVAADRPEIPDSHGSASPFESRLAALEREVELLKQELASFRKQFD